MKSNIVLAILVLLMAGCSIHHTSVPRVWNPLKRNTSAQTTKHSDRKEKSRVAEHELVEVQPLPVLIDLDTATMVSTVDQIEIGTLYETPIITHPVVKEDSSEVDSSGLQSGTPTLDSENKILFGALLSVNLAMVLMPEIGSAMQILLLFPIFVTLGFVVALFIGELTRNRFPKKRTGPKDRRNIKNQARKVRRVGFKMWLGSLISLLLFVISFDFLEFGFIFGILSLSLFYIGLIILLISLVMSIV